MFKSVFGTFRLGLNLLLWIFSCLLNHYTEAASCKCQKLNVCANSLFFLTVRRATFIKAEPKTHTNAHEQTHTH